MREYNRKEVDPDYFKSCDGLMDMCNDLVQHKFIGGEYRSDTRCGRFGLRKNVNHDRMQKQMIYEFYNPQNDNTISHGESREETILSAQCSYFTFYIFKDEKEMWAWIKEWEELTFVKDIEELEI